MSTNSTFNFYVFTAYKATGPKLRIRSLLETLVDDADASLVEFKGAFDSHLRFVSWANNILSDVEIQSDSDPASPEYSRRVLDLCRKTDIGPVFEGIAVSSWDEEDLKIPL